MKLRILILPAILALLILYTRLSISRLFPTEEWLSWEIALSIFAIMVGSQIIYRVAGFSSTNPLSKAFAWTGAVVIGAWATFIIFSLIVDFVYLIAALWQVVPANVNEPLPYLMYKVFLGVLTISCATTALGFFQATRGPEVKEVTIPVSSPSLAGLKIVQLSDLHIGATIHKEYIQNVVERAMALSPDIIAITGDIADGKPADLRMHSEPLAQLKAPLGTYFITGNHEYYSGVELWLEEAKMLGFISHINENRIVIYNGEKILVGGVTDITAHQFIAEHRSDPTKAIASTEATSFKLLLAHQPESCFAAEFAGFDLQLSGHTHAGQFFPFNILVKWAKRYYQGLNRHGNMWLYVNAGTGYWGAVNRFAVPSEITLIRLSLEKA